MNPDSRGRLPGPSAYKKRQTGRAKKRKYNFRKKNNLSIATSTSSSIANSSKVAQPRSSLSQQPSTSGISMQTEKQKIPNSRSSQKLQLKSMQPSSTEYRLIDISLFFPGLSEFLVCQACRGNVTFSEVDIRGLGSKISITCSKCKKVAFIDTSRKIGKQSNAYEVNKRSVLAARCLGQGLNGLKTFCGIMDLPAPVSHSNYDNINLELKVVTQEVAKISMNAALLEDCDGNTEENLDVTVSGDGTWRKRGYSSLQGVSSLIRNKNGKVIDVAPKQSFCRGCELHPEEDTEIYREWYATHQDVCSANHTGSSGKMEVDGIVDMFKRSESTYGVRYANYIGDGDSKVFKALCDAKPYGEEFEITKKECVGHVQKRMGTRLRNLKSNWSGKKLADDKGIGGRDRLTAQRIDQLTRYYGNAIRANSQSVEKMANAIWATFYHKISTDEHPQHHLCPTGANTWCKWQKAKNKNQQHKFKHTSSFPVAIMDLIKPIYEDLTKPELLERCIGGYTQNSNESFNQSIWKLVPKQSFSGLTVLEIGVYIAVICFNDGKSQFLEVMQKLEILPGSSATSWARSADQERLFWAEKKSAAATLEARRAKRKQTHEEDESYSAGAF